MRKAFLFSMILALTSGTAFNMIFFAPSRWAQDGIAMEKAFKSVTEVPVNKVSITVVFDNNPYREELTTSWGFACFIRGPEKTILFDTGGSSAVLLGNMQRLGIDPKDIDIVVLSHIHGDHVGGLEGLLKANLDVEVYLPATFPLGFKDFLTHAGIKALEVNDPVRICKGIYSTGVQGSWMKEQALIISTDRGLIVVTGCAHPGIVKILKTAKELIADQIFLVIGGFHLDAMRKAQLEEIIANFRKLGVEKIGPCHCTGELARQTFKQEYGNDFLDVGVGRLIEFE